MAFCIEKRNTWLQQTVVYFELFFSCLQSTSYILAETTAPSRAPASWLLRLVRGRDCGDQQPALSSCSKRFSGGSNVETTDRIHQPLVSSTDFDNLFSTIGVASNPSFLSRILSRAAWRFSPKLWDKVRDGKPGFEATGGGCMLTLTCK